MALTRLIAMLLHKHGHLVLSRNFARHHSVGGPVEIAHRYKTWDIDELIYLDISPHWPASAGDVARPALEDIVAQVARNCFTPLAVGGGIRGLGDIAKLMRAGADRFVLNTGAIEKPDLIDEAAHRYGAQAVIVAVDCRRMPDGSYRVFSAGGRRDTGYTPESWCREVERRGAGEILLNSIDRDGSASGFDIDLIYQVTSSISLPVIAAGGAGRPDMLAQPIADGGAAAVAAANMFTFTELSYHEGKQALRQAGIQIREGVVSRDYAAARVALLGTESRLGAEQERIWAELEHEGIREIQGNAM